jgi:purine-binding chemotaxis protein CheW
MSNETAAPSPDTRHAVDAGNEESTSAICQFVTFIVGDEVFAVDMAPVQEIIRVPEVVRVPLAPATLEGLANLRGKVLPIISLRRIFGFAECAHDDASRAVVIDQGQPLGFVVDRVASVISIDPRQIEDTGSISTTVNTELVSGLLKDVGGYPMIMVLDFTKLTNNEFAGMAHRNVESSVQSAHQLSKEEDQFADILQLVSFEAAGQEYAIVIDDVQEIVQVPETIVHVPHSASHVLGMMMLRNRLLPLVSLRRMFNLPERDSDEDSRIMVVSLGAASVGVVMDSVNEVLRVARADVDAMPALLAREDDLSEIAEICRLDGGKRLVSILSVKNMFRHSAMREALITVDAMKQKQDQTGAEEQDADTGNDEVQVVIFRLGKEEFGVPIESVQEIVRVPGELTHVPKAASSVEGVINLRGAVLPVIDLRRRLGLEDIERTDGQRIMVIIIDGVCFGFIVDSVKEVLKIHKSTIEQVPRLSSNQSRLLARMANLEQQKRMVQLIEPQHLMENHEQPELAEAEAEA